MAYNPREYWDERYAREGVRTVGRSGMDEARVARQGDVFAAAALDMLPFKASRTLDFGCGVGRLFDDLALQSEVCLGVDLCEKAVSTARMRHGSPCFFHLKRDSIPFPGGFFDCAVACTVLQHIVSPAQFALWCREINRVLAPGGCVVVIDDNSIGQSAAHVEFRRPQVVAEALGVLIEKEAKVSAERPDSHWVFRGRKP